MDTDGGGWREEGGDSQKEAKGTKTRQEAEGRRMQDRKIEDEKMEGGSGPVK